MLIDFLFYNVIAIRGITVLKNSTQSVFLLLDSSCPNYVGGHNPMANMMMLYYCFNLECMLNEWSLKT